MGACNSSDDFVIRFSGTGSFDVHAGESCTVKGDIEHTAMGTGAYSVHGDVNEGAKTLVLDKRLTGIVISGDADVTLTNTNGEHFSVWVEGNGKLLVASTGTFDIVKNGNKQIEIAI